MGAVLRRLLSLGRPCSRDCCSGHSGGVFANTFLCSDWNTAGCEWEVGDGVLLVLLVACCQNLMAVIVTGVGEWAVMLPVVCCQNLTGVFGATKGRKPQTWRNERLRICSNSTPLSSAKTNACLIARVQQLSQRQTRPPSSLLEFSNPGRHYPVPVRFYLCVAVSVRWTEEVCVDADPALTKCFTHLTFFKL